MPPVRTVPPIKAVKTERTHEENQERAYIAASRRSDRSLEARVESARRASEIHEKRTGRRLRVTEQDVVNEEMYEEIDDGIPWNRRMNHIRTGSNGFDNRLEAMLRTQYAFRAGAAWANGNADASPFVANMFPMWGQQAQPQIAMPQTPNTPGQPSPAPNMPNMTMQNLQNMQNMAMHNRNMSMQQMQNMNMQQMQKMGMNQNTQNQNMLSPRTQSTPMQQNQQVRQASRPAPRPAPYPQPRPQSDWSGTHSRSASVKVESPESLKGSPLSLVSEEMRRLSAPASTDAHSIRPTPKRTPSCAQGSFKGILKPVPFLQVKQEDPQDAPQFYNNQEPNIDTDLLSCKLPAEAQAFLSRSKMQSTPLGAAMMAGSDNMPQPPQSVNRAPSTPNNFNHGQFGASLDGLGSTLAPSATSSSQEHQDFSQKPTLYSDIFSFDSSDDSFFDEFITGWGSDDPFSSNESELFV